MSAATSRLRARADGGFALVVVIWAIGILSLLFTTYIAAARYRSYEATSLAARARADAMAAAAVHIAIFDLLSGMAEGKVRSARFALNGAPLFCTLGEHSRVAISVVDEGGKVDLNAADADIVRTLLRSVLRDSRMADQLAGRILDLRKRRPPESAEGGQEASTDGRVVGRMRTILELDQALGADRTTVLALLPLVTVHSGTPGVDAEVAPTAVLRALSRGDSDAFTRASAQRSLPAAFAAPSPGRAFSVAAEAITASGARAMREAVVEFSPNVVNGHRVREWRDGLRRLMDASGGGGEGLPPC